MSGRWSLRARLTATVALVTSAALVVFAALLFVVVRRTAWQQHDQALLARARALSAIAEHDDDGYEMALPPEPPGQPASYIEAWTETGVVLARSESLGTRDLSRLPPDLDFADTELPDGRDGRMVALRFVPRDEARRTKAGPVVLVVAEGTEQIEVAVSSVRTWFIALGLGAIVVLALVTSWTLARGLRPLVALAARIGEIDDRRLSDRLSSRDLPVELEVPVHKLNELLARLDASFSRERQFTSDVSHELRTPLAGLRTLLEVTSLSNRSTAEYATALGTALGVVKQLGTLVENLIELARLEGGQLEIAHESVALHALVDECWRPYGALATSRGVAFTNSVPADAIARTDGERLRIVIANLLANAAEYTESNGWIDVASIEGGVVEVADSGPGIPADQLERVFDRLWRGDAARSRTGVHCGIGLSLARAICARLSFSLVATSTPGRVAFRITPGAST